MSASFEAISSSYFSLMAKRFPVMCASDEFHFVPRAMEAAQYYDRLDDLDAASMEESISILRDHDTALGRLDPVGNGPLEEAIDLELLKASVTGALLEFSESRSWCHNPLLYLKIAFIGLDHALTKPCGTQTERWHRVGSRLDGICRLLRQGMENLSTIPAGFHRAAILMTGDCGRYLHEVAPVISLGEPCLQGGLQRVYSTLGKFAAFLESVFPVPDDAHSSLPVATVLRGHFRSLRTLEEVYEIGGDEWSHCLGQVKALAREIDGQRSWRDLYHGYLPEAVATRSTLELYENEMESLQDFFKDHGLAGTAVGRLPHIRSTPTYLESVRSSASFCAAFTRDEREDDFFYITLAPPGRRGPEASDLLRKRLHREYRFLTAHETFPGHFLLDSTRRTLSNPIRSQIESPLFYEGWAYYVESLLVDHGYVKDPMDCLVDLKRRLWRAARCRIDIGLAAGFISMGDAMDLLMAVGFSREESTAQVERFRLNHGYQLCYSLGRYEIMRLRESFRSAIGLDLFHREILNGGEIPFHLLEKKLEKIASTGNQPDRSAH